MLSDTIQVKPTVETDAIVIFVCVPDVFHAVATTFGIVANSVGKVIYFADAVVVVVVIVPL